MCSVELAFFTAQAVFAGYGMYSQQQAANDQADYQSAVAEQQADVMEMNRDMADRQAKDIKAQGDVDAKNHMQKVAALRSEQAGRLAANGLDLNYGSPLLLQEETTFMGQYDADAIKNNAARQAWATQIQGANYGAQADASSLSAKMYQSQKSSPMTSALTGMVSTVASNWGGPNGIGQAGKDAGLWGKPKVTTGTGKSGLNINWSAVNMPTATPSM